MLKFYCTHTLDITGASYFFNFIIH